MEWTGEEEAERGVVLLILMYPRLAGKLSCMVPLL